MSLGDAVRTDGSGMPPHQAYALIADADPEVRAILTAAVGLAGLTASQVQNGRQAIELLAAVRPSVVLVSVQLPGLSGIEVCWWLRRQRHLADVPVILVSAVSSQFEIDAGRLAGANHYVTMPFTSAGIRAVVARHLVARP